MSVTTNDVRSYVKKKLFLLRERGDNSIAAELAKLRRGVGCAPGEIPELWGYFLEDMPEEMLSVNGAPTFAEWACYTALTLFALHQQGSDIKTGCVNAEDMPLGKAIRLLAPNEDELPAVRRRFNSMATSDDIAEAAGHLRGLVQLLRSKNIPLDYPALAADLYDFQFSDRLPRVRLRWGEQFYRAVGKKSDDNKQE